MPDLMNRVLSGIASFLIVVCGLAHVHLGGLRILLNGEPAFSNSLVSSGSNDSVLVQFGMFAFVVSVVASLANRVVAKCFYFNAVLFFLVLLLVDIDVPIIESIKLGDYVLVVAIALVSAPMLHHLTMRST
ncbi:hypothetical protein [Marinagarivorans algicola]|uniref:hypothetical protein n=1 Tax=Marinagarivorans algicola TaxID=1513270 RepID=UPI0012E1268A|nr:hypothetical protein [Marinagarivorans algicola]